MRSLGFYVVLVLATVVLGLFGMVVAAIRPEGRLVGWTVKLWAHVMLRTAGVRLEVQGRERLVATRPAIVLANHLSAVDIWALVSLIPWPFKFVAKQELRHVPVFGWVVLLARQIMVDRANREHAIQSLKRAVPRLTQRPMVVIIFPEGTRSRTGALGPFKKGGFHLALETRLPILPVAIQGAFEVWPKGRFRIQSGLVRLQVGQPISTTGFDREEEDRLMEVVRGSLVRLLVEAAPTRPEQFRAGRV